MGKYIKIAITIIILAACGVGYYYYLANKTAEKDATTQSVTNEELAYLTSINLNVNYPESVRDIVKLYARITQAYYAYDLSDEQIEKLGKQARNLFDDELKGSQTEKEFLKALKEDIDNYKKNNVRISNYNIQSASNTKYSSFKERSYASLSLVYFIRQDSELHNSYTKFTLRKDVNNRWKILYWELVDPMEIN